MTISYIAGTTAGSVFAYVLDRIIHYEVGWSGGEYHRAENAIVRGGFELINKSLLTVLDPANHGSSTAAVSPAPTAAAATTLAAAAAAAATTTIGRLVPVLVPSSAVHVNATAGH